MSLCYVRVTYQTFGSLIALLRPEPRFLHHKIPMARIMALGSVLHDYNLGWDWALGIGHCIDFHDLYL